MSNMTPPSISFLEMNNLGIRYLDSGNYEKAADLFRSAFNTLKRHLKQQNQWSCSDETSSSFDDDNNFVRQSSSSSSQSNSTTTPQESSSSSHVDSTTKERTSDLPLSSKRQHGKDATTTTTPLKRRKLNRGGLRSDSNNNNNIADQETTTSTAVPPVTSAAATPTSGHVPLGRPIRLAQPRHLNSVTWGTLNVYATSVLYNFAYALHRGSLYFAARDGLNNDSTTARHVRLQKHAANVYDMSIRLSIRGRSPVVLWLSCHNLQQLLMMETTTATQQECPKYQELEMQKAKVLRFLTSGSRRRGVVLGASVADHNPRRPQQIYLMVLALLGISDSENPDSPAAAA